MALIYIGRLEIEVLFTYYTMVVQCSTKYFTGQESKHSQFLLGNTIFKISGITIYSQLEKSLLG